MGLESFRQALTPRNPILARAVETFVFSPLALILSKAFPPARRNAKLAQRFYENPLSVPTLILGSEKDAIVQHKEMVEYAEIAAKRGISVETRFWPDSGHVRVWKDHSKEYADIVRAFTKAHLLL
jgi:acetyl esterase/lipase